MLLSRSGGMQAAATQQRLRAEHEAALGELAQRHAEAQQSVIREHAAAVRAADEALQAARRDAWKAALDARKACARARMRSRETEDRGGGGGKGPPLRGFLSALTPCCGCTERSRHREKKRARGLMG